jgi:hypothetical protein
MINESGMIHLIHPPISFRFSSEYGCIWLLFALLVAVRLAGKRGLITK